MKRYQKINAGFTLSELLAVVIIVGMLSILGVGYYNKSVEQARFREGESLGTAMAEAYNRWCYDRLLEGKTTCQYASSEWAPPFSSLDIEIPHATSCGDRCRQTKYFRLEFATNGNVHVTRGKAAEDWAKNYRLWVNPGFKAGGAVSYTSDIRCVASKAKGSSFCQSVGYTACSVPSGADYHVCTRPNS